MVRISVAQLSPSASRDENLERTARLLDRAAADAVGLVVLPELFSVPFVGTTPDPDYFSWCEELDGASNALVAEKSAEHGFTVVSSVFEASSTPGVYHNTSCVYESGRRLCSYRKAHLPFSHGFPEKFYFTPGNEPPAVVPTAAGHVGVAICYERHYPELSRLAALAGAEVYCIPVAAASASMQDVFHLELRAHAAFNGMFVACANRRGAEGGKHYFGKSAICAPDGELLAVAGGETRDELVIADIDLDAVRKARIDRPFLRDRRPELYRGLTS